MERFPGFLLNGLNLYSFAMFPDLIQPSGHLNLTTADVQLEIESIADPSD